MSFEERYKNLNSEQKKAVDAIEGPVMVVAGPGTGKTEILTLRIANILTKTDTQPENILALTFTDAAAANMRRRLSLLIGASAYRVVIETFHSFCNNVIKDYPEYFPTIIGSGNITEVESLSILSELIETLPLDILRPWGEKNHYIKDINKKIEELKREGLSPAQFSNVIDNEEKKFLKKPDLYHEKGAYKGKMKNEHKDFERKIQKNKELALIYEAYQKILRKRRLYDWSDMIMEVLGALQGSQDLKLSLQENHQYVLVDEHQDTNNAQNKILELLGDFHTNPNIFIVGDEKQAIFRFQGASVENFQYFKKIYTEAVLIELSKNYRSGQNVLDAAHSLLPTNIPLTSSVSKTKQIQNTDKILVAEFSNKSRELYFVAEHIKNLIAKEVSPSEIAVIYRSNREAFPMAHMLEKMGVTYTIESDEDLLSEKFVRKYITILSAISHYSEDEYIIPALHLDEFGIDPLDAYRVIAEASKKRVSVYILISESDNEALIELSKKLKKWAVVSHSEHLSQFLELILRESGILNSMIASKDAQAFLGIERLFEEGKRISSNRQGATFADFMEYIDVVREHKLFIKRPKHSRVQAVRLMTAHRSKGLEFEYVHIINATEYSFGEKSNRDHLPLLPAIYALDKSKTDFVTDMDDERRLFYVSMTRAKKSVLISYSTLDENNKEMLPSPFVLEIRPDRIEKIEMTQFEDMLQHDPSLMFVESKTNGVMEIDRVFVTDLFHSHPMSVTALNNYLSCPWKYFYRNLLRIPSAPERHQLYGTAMHATIEDIWRVIKEREVDLKFVLDSYKRHLGLLGLLTPREYKEALDRGEKALTGWFAWAKPTLTNPVIPEFTIPAVHLEPGIALSGKLDKLEIVGTSKAIVTDYKTGKQKSHNDILGLTKSSTGDMKRQLQFYKLLLRLHDNIEMQSGIIEFLEPNDSGKYSREEFEITDEEVSEITETIKRVADEVTTLKFWNMGCNEKDCEYCEYRTLLEN